jgi:glucose-1-phosphate thymidylyltransferase
MILGDNIFEDDLSEEIKNFTIGGKIFVTEVDDQESSGVAEIDENSKVLSIEEKPVKPKSNLAITGLYVYDNKVVKAAKEVKPSERGELEITDIHNWYLKRNELFVSKIKGEWIDAGTFDSLLRAQIFAKEKMQDKMII